MVYILAPLRLCKHNFIHIVNKQCVSNFMYQLTESNKASHKRVQIDKNTLALLERLSLVKCDTQEGVKVLEDSIAFANSIHSINTVNVKPLYTVLENENLHLRPDNVTQGNCQKDILVNACLEEDDYFVAPPGNIPLHEIKDSE